MPQGLRVRVPLCANLKTRLLPSFLIYAEAHQLLGSEAFKAMENVRICGVMGMATFTDDEAEIRKEFKHLKEIFETLKTDYFADQPQFKEISMGMSDDYPIAIEEGATLIRVGSKIFGARNYNK